MKRRILSLLLCGTMLFSPSPQSAFAEVSAQTAEVSTQTQGSERTAGAGSLCEHHPEHDSECGYTEGEPGRPCGHEHTEDCYTEVTKCTHKHAEDCYPETEDSESDDVATPSEATKREPENCTHVCSEESGCITRKLNCQHEHDSECGYIPATEGTPCGYVCEICSAEDGSEADILSDVEEAVTVERVQAMIDALPGAEEITKDNAEDVKAQLEAIDEAKAELSDEELDQLDFTKYVSAAEALGSVYAASPAAEDEVRYSTDDGNTWKYDSLVDAIWDSYFSQNVVIELLQDITLDSSWEPQDLGYKNTVVFDGKDFSITRSSGVGCVFVVRNGSNVTLRDITIDGGAVWSSEDPAARTNSGVVKKGATNHLIYVAGDATLTLESGVILQNADMGNTAYGAAIVVGYGGEDGNGKLIMEDGAEIKNNAAESGGAVCVWGDGDVFEMRGGTISGNYASSGGGAVFIYGGSFIMEGGEISNNASGNNGGGVTVNDSFTMTGGSISGNKSAAGGGGVTILYGTVDLTGGNITDNKITGTLGGGLLVNGGSLTVSGDPVVTGNTDKNADSNIYLQSNKTITVSDSLDGSAWMGVTTATAPTETIPVNITGSNDADYSSSFFSDASYSVVNNNNYVQLAMLPCKVTFDANEGTGQMDAQSFTSGVAETLSPNIFTRENYAFAGWNTKMDGSGTSYKDGQSIVVSEDITLYAQWEHAHSWGEWKSNGDGTHTRICEIDGSHTEVADCIFDSDGKCTACGYTRITITAQPQDNAVKEGQTATFSVTARGDNIASYQWQISTDGGEKWTDLSGATEAAYTTAAVTMEMDGWMYQCVVSNSGDSVASNAATLTVNKAASEIIPGDTVRYMVEHYKASGDGYVLEETEYLGGTIGTTVAAEPKTYTGYTYNPDAAGSVASGTLTAISSAADIVTLKLYYDLTIYTVTVENDGNGEASASPTSAAMGEEITLTAEAADGYQFKEWEVVSGGVTISDNKFTMPADHVTVKAVFEKASDEESGGDTSGDDSSDENTTDGNTSGENTSGDGTTGGDTTGDETSDENTTGGDTSGSNSSGSNTSGGSSSSGSSSSSGRSSGGGGSSSAVSRGTTTTDSQKGQVNSINGIVTGTTGSTENDGYSHWIQDENGWKLRYADGSYASGTVTEGEEEAAWEKIDGSWYLFGADSYAKFGWHLDSPSGHWYYLDENTGMKTGWHLDPQDGCWYYLDADGKMLTGWQKIGGQWYFLNVHTPEPTWEYDENEKKWKYLVDAEHRPYGSRFQLEKTPDGYYVDENGVWDGKAAEK